MQELEGQLWSEKQINSEHTRQMEELRRHVTQNEYVDEALSIIVVAHIVECLI